MKALAVARPMPLLPPVIRAILFFRRMIHAPLGNDNDLDYDRHLEGL
ncbi:hypothetical protein RHECNPAF_1740051 [Rhizobium etli CNPAF512]|nr:hypothetical protein RHECNPAF_1740051 [Rhizobium etli CNPAF512]